MIQQRQRLKAYFAPPGWQSSMASFPKSGFNLAAAILALRPRFVVDAGCGYNEFKGCIPNCIGIDFANPKADLVCEFAEAPIKDDSIDVVLALGSVNFGDEDNIRADLAVLARWLAPGGRLFMRGNPGEPLEDPAIVVFPWSPATVQDIGTSVGLRLATEVDEERLVTATGRAARRLLWVYEKPR